MVLVKGRTPYTPQNPTAWFGALSKKPGLSKSGRTAKPSICQGPRPVFTLNPSKLKRTCGPSRTSISRPEPYSISCRPTLLNPLPFISCSDFEKCRLEIQLLFVDRSRSTDTIRIETAFEFHERANLLAVMNVEIEHVPFVEIGVHESLLAPVVVSDLFPNLASFAAHGQEPVIPIGPQTNVFDGVPELLPLSRRSEKTPVIVLAKQVIDPCWCRGFNARNRLASRDWQTRKRHEH